MSRGLYRTLLIIVTILCVLAGSAFNITRIFFKTLSHLVPFADRLEEEIGNSDWFDWNEDSFITFGVNGSGEQTHEEWNEDYSDCKKFDIDITVGNVDIIRGEEFLVAYDGDENLKPEVSLNDGTLKIRQPQQKDLQLNLGNTNSRITITVPEDQLEELKLEADFGDIDIEDLTLVSLEIETNAGEIGLSNITADDMKLDADAGNIRIADAEADNISVDANAGDLEISNVKADDLNVEVDAGDIGLSDVDMRKGEVTLSMGNFTYDGGTFKDLSVTVNMGDLHINTDSSLSDYGIDLSCDMGEVQYNGKPEGTSYNHDGEEGKLNAKCNMGEVEVSGN